MSDLISRKELLKEMNDCKFDTVNDVARRTEHIVKSHMFELVENQPTAFDLESVIEQLEEKRDYCYSEMEKERNNTDYFSEHIFEENHNRAVAFGESIEILKSAVNATDGKNGG